MLRSNWCTQVSTCVDVSCVCLDRTSQACGICRRRVCTEGYQRIGWDEAAWKGCACERGWLNKETVQWWAFPVRKQPTSLCTKLKACTSAVVLLVGLNMKGWYGLARKLVPGTCVSSVCEADVGFGVQGVRSTHGPEWCSVC